MFFTPLDGFTLFPALMSAVLTAYNLVRWPRDTALLDPRGKVSVLIPARNEAAGIRDAVTTALGALRPVDELIVCDDASEDGTRAILDELSGRDPRLHVIDGRPLPAGSVGKPHACQQLSEVATGDLLVFVDADVRLRPDALPRLASLLDRYDAGIVSGLPQQVYGTFAERAVMPFLAITFTSWLPLDLVWRSPRPWVIAALGQVMAIRRDTYDRVGGFASVEHEVVDDVAFARRAKKHGERVVFAALDRAASCRMYDGPRAMWNGFSKNLFEGGGERWEMLIGAVVLYLCAFVLPFVRLGVELALWGRPSWVTVGAVGANVVTRLLLAARFGDSVVGLLLHPLAALAVPAMALNSWRWASGDGVRWRGRTYSRRRARRTP